MRVFTGVVVGLKMAKTAIVEVERKTANPIYGKIIRTTRNYHVHTEKQNVLNLGDKVHFVQSRPYSKTKKWKIVKILGKDAESEKLNDMNSKTLSARVRKPRHKKKGIMK